MLPLVGIFQDWQHISLLYNAIWGLKRLNCCQFDGLEKECTIWELVDMVAFVRFGVKWQQSDEAGLFQSGFRVIRCCGFYFRQYNGNT